MKKSSNEPKNERHEMVKATFKVILKRYFLLPTLLCVFHFIGRNVLPIIDNSYDDFCKEHRIISIILTIAFGACCMWAMIIVCILFILGLSGLISYLKKRTIIQDLKGLLYDIQDCMQEIIDDIVRFPRKIYNRVKEEPELFREAVTIQLTKEKENNEKA